MSEIPPRPQDVTPHTVWEWIDGQWVEREKTPEELAADQPPEVVHVPKPADTETGTWESSIMDVDGIPTQVWTPREWTFDELSARAAIQDKDAARVAVKQIIADLRLEKDRAQAVIDNPNSTARERDLGRSCKRIADAVIDLVRFLGVV